MNLVWMRRGYVISNGGRRYVAVKVTECGAKCVPTSKKLVVLQPLAGAKRQFESCGDVITVSAKIEPEYVLERWTDAELNDFLTAGKAARRPGETTKAAEGKGTEMKKKQADKKADGAAKAERIGGLGEIMGHSVGSVLKRLGMADVTAAHARAIMEKLGVDKRAASPETFANTVAWNITAGKSGRGKVAQITKEQVEELKAMAPVPAEEPKQPKAKAKAAKAKSKGKKAAKAKGGGKQVEAKTEPVPAAAATAAAG